MARSMGNGGAEQQVTELARGLDKQRFELTVTSFYPGGTHWFELEHIPGVRRSSLQKNGRWDLTGFLMRSLKMAKSIQPHVVYSFSAEPNLVALIVGRVLKARVVWGIRRSTKRLPLRDWVGMTSLGLGAPLSHAADAVVYNSYCGRKLYIQRGYCERNAVVVPNGFDTTRFHRDAELRERQRAGWGISDSEALIGIAGRLDPVKDHRLFFRAAAQFRRTHQSARFICIGGGPSDYQGKLRQFAGGLGLDGCVLWTGNCEDMTGAYNALDLLALCSKEEGCPNVVGEAMACGVPCVATDAGDAARLIGDSGIVVRSDEVQAMAAGWRKVLEASPEERARRGTTAREHVVRNYSLRAMVDKTEAVLTKGLS